MTKRVKLQNTETNQRGVVMIAYTLLVDDWLKVKHFPHLRIFRFRME